MLDYHHELSYKIKNEILSHDTSSKIFSLINPKELMNILIECFKEAISQKGLRKSD